jgi:uncharacterized RDD family membrane protein YckC
MKTDTGVYFRTEDYASFWRRLLADVIDVFAVALVWTTLTIVLLSAFPSSETTLDLTLATCTGTTFCYLVVLKRSKIRTAGYRAAGVRIVGLDGKTASWSALVLRLVFVPLGPFNWFLDLIWLAGDPHRQALRDKFAHTYVVKAKAEPAGDGSIVFRHTRFAGITSYFKR